MRGIKRDKIWYVYLKIKGDKIIKIYQCLESKLSDFVEYMQRTYKTFYILSLTDEFIQPIIFDI